MNGIDGMVSRIRADSEARCDEIARKAAEECESIRIDYAQTEQDEYWRFLSASAKEMEQRMEQLNDLASQESKKQIHATQQELLDAAFDLAVEKLLELPGEKYLEILAGLNIESDCTASDLVGRSKERLSPLVMEALFD